MRGRTTIDLEPYKAQIITWFQDENKTSDEIAQLLCETYDKLVAPRTIKRCYGMGAPLGPPDRLRLTGAVT
jgi:hypothetical protein